METATRGKPPAGTYVGRLLASVRSEQKDGKNDSTYIAGNALVHVKGGDGPVEVDGRYEFTGLTYQILDFFRSLKEGDTFVFTVYMQNGYPRLSGLKAKTELEELLARFED